MPERKFVFGIRPDSSGALDVVASTSRPEVIALALQELAKPEDQRKRMINGIIERGNDGNRGWSWHFRPDAWEFAESAAEVCDGKPTDVEADLEYWLGSVGRFCPWSSYVKQAL